MALFGLTVSTFFGGWRRFGSAPASSATAVVVQALGIGATIVVFSLMVGVRQIRPGGVATAGGELVELRYVPHDATFFASALGWFSYPEYRAFQQPSPTFAGVAASMGLAQIPVGIRRRFEAVPAVLSTSNYLQVLGVRPVTGRGFTTAEERPGDAAVCLLSQRLVRRWALEGSVPGATVVVRGQPITVVGVLPEPFGGTNYGARAEIWFPLGLHELFFPDGALLDGTGPGPHGRPVRRSPLQLVARLRAGKTSKIAAVEATTILRREQSLRPSTGAGAAVVVDPLLAYGHIERLQLLPVFAAFGLAAALMLTMTVVNVGGLEMALAIRRQRDVAIRLALGASRHRIFVERLGESVALSLVAGGFGVLFARGLLRFLASVVTGAFLGRLFESASMANWRMPVFVVAASMLTALASGLLPAWSAGRTAPMVVLQGGGWIRPRARGTRRGVLAAQAAVVTLLAFIGAASARSISKTESTSPGFDTRGLLVAHVDPVGAGYDRPKALEFARRLLDALNGPSRARTATLSRLTPVNRSTVSDSMAIVDGGTATQVGSVAYDEVAPDYFDVLGIPMLGGRSFQASDSAGTAPVIVVNAHAAKTWPWPSGKPIGSLVRLGPDGIPRTVIGIVADVASQGPLSRPEAFAYLPLFQRTNPSVFDNFGFTVNLRDTRAPASASARIRAAVRALDPMLSIEEPRSIKDLIAEILPMEKMLRNVNSIFALLALLVCSVGFYATASQMTLEREREFGLRIALGARTTDILSLLLRWWVATVGTGLAVGLASGALLGLAVGRSDVVLTVDALVVVTVCTIVVTVSLAATSLPARFALRLEPAAALRLPAEGS
jgi:putative ABC transport system permease protein